jgi:hypothetical protein
MEEIRIEQSNNLDEITKIEDDAVKTTTYEQKNTDLLPKKSNLKASTSSSLQIDVLNVQIEEPNKVKIEETIEEQDKNVLGAEILGTASNAKKPQKLPVGVKSILIRINNLFVLIFIPLILAASKSNRKSTQY